MFAFITTGLWQNRLAHRLAAIDQQNLPFLTDDLYSIFLLSIQHIAVIELKHKTNYTIVLDLHLTA